MAKCPRCLKPIDDDRNCVDARCNYQVEGSSVRPLSAIFSLAGMLHLALFWRIGVPIANPPDSAAFWFFVGLCWLLVNSVLTIALYAAYVFAFERESGEFLRWLRRARTNLQSIARGNELPKRTAR
jgi:hypothetical protein